MGWFDATDRALKQSDEAYAEGLKELGVSELYLLPGAMTKGLVLTGDKNENVFTFHHSTSTIRDTEYTLVTEKAPWKRSRATCRWRRSGTGKALSQHYTCEHHRRVHLDILTGRVSCLWDVGMHAFYNGCKKTVPICA